MFTVTNDIKSLGIITVYLIVPLFMISVITMYFINFISGLGLFTMLGPATGNWGPEYVATITSLVAQLDRVIFLIFAVLVGKLTIQSFRTNIHPIYGLVGLFSLPALLVMAAFGSNVVGTFTSIEIFQSSVNEFPITYTFFENSPTIVGWIAVFILFVMIGSGIIQRRRSGSGGGLA